jgi:hypothetical protein
MEGFAMTETTLLALTAALTLRTPEGNVTVTIERDGQWMGRGG